MHSSPFGPDPTRLDLNPAWLAERRRRGLDRWDEVWDGVLHLVSTPSSFHQSFESDLEAILRPIAHARALKVFHNLAVFDPIAGESNYRVPDLSVVKPQLVSKRGIEAHAELVIEILSPDDESRAKLPFYARCQIPEVWLIDPVTRAAEVFVLREQLYLAAAPPRDGVLEAPRLGLALRVVEGPRLVLTGPEGSAEL